MLTSVVINISSLSHFRTSFKTRLKRFVGVGSRGRYEEWNKNVVMQRAAKPDTLVPLHYTGYQLFP